VDTHLLFRKRHQLDEVPFAMRGDEIHTCLARRNTTGQARPSAILVRALLAALQGSVTEAWTSNSSVFAVVQSNSRPGTGATCSMTRDAFYIPHGAPDKVTYHVGVLALVAALAQPERAKDLLEAYADLLKGYQTHGLAEPIKSALLRAADELYFQVRYADQHPDEANDRLAGMNVFDTTTATPTIAPLATAVEIEALTDPEQLKRVRQQARRARKVKGKTADGFQRKVSGAIGRAVARLADQVEAVLQRGGTPLLVGPTGVGKTSAVRLLAVRNGWAFEEIAGSPSFADADLVGLRMADRDVPGVFARAFERARGGETVLMFLDEFTRFNTRAQDILMRPLLPVPAEVAQAMQIVTDEPLRMVEVPLWGMDWAPAAGVHVVLACNPWGSTLDPALVRRAAPIEVAFDAAVADLFDKPIVDVVKASWKAAADGQTPLPIEYQALASAAGSDDTGFVADYLTRLAVVDRAASLGFRKIAEGLGMQFAGGGHD